MKKSTKPLTRAEKKAIMAGYYNPASVLVTETEKETR